TALMWAAAQRRPEAVRVLVAAGADLKARSRTGLTPLVFAVRAGDGETTRILLDAGAAVTETAPDGTGLLVLAILNAHYDVAAFLVDRGADVNVADDNCGYPLHCLTWIRRQADGGLVIPRVPTGALDSFGLAETLIAHGANVNKRLDWEEKAPGRGRQPRQLAAPPWGLSYVGATPLFIAALNTDAPWMRFLASHGADARIPTRQNVTPLLAAAGIATIKSGG